MGAIATVGCRTPSLWLRRPTGAGGGLRGRLPAAGATDLPLIRSFGAAAVGGRDLASCCLAGLLLGLSLLVAQAAKESKGGGPAKYPQNAKVAQILLRIARDACHPTAAEIRAALEKAGGDALGPCLAAATLGQGA